MIFATIRVVRSWDLAQVMKDNGKLEVFVDQKFTTSNRVEVEIQEASVHMRFLI